MDETALTEPSESIVTYRVNVWGNRAALAFASEALATTKHIFSDQVGASGSSLQMLGEFAERVVQTDAWESDDIGWLLRDDAETLTARKGPEAATLTAANARSHEPATRGSEPLSGSSADPSGVRARAPTGGEELLLRGVSAPRYASLSPILRFGIRPRADCARGLRGVSRA